MSRTQSVDPALPAPLDDLVVVVAEEQGGVIFLLQGLDTFQVVEELVCGGVDGAAGGQLVPVAVGGVHRVAGGEDGPVVLGLQDHA